MITVLTQDGNAIVDCEVTQIVNIKKEQRKTVYGFPKDYGFCVYGGTDARRRNLGWYETEERAKAILREMFTTGKYEMPKE